MSRAPVIVGPFLAQLGGGGEHVSGGVATLSISIDLSHASALTSTISHLDAKIFLSKFDDQFQIYIFLERELSSIYIYWYRYTIQNINLRYPET